MPYPLVISLLTALGKDSNAEKLKDTYRKFNEMTGLNVSRYQSYILVSFIVVVLKRSLAHAVERGMDKEISTRKVLMSGTHIFGDLMLALLELNRRHVFRDLKKLLEFWQKNGQREHPARDRRSGRSALSLTALGCA